MSASTTRLGLFLGAISLLSATTIGIISYIVKKPIEIADRRNIEKSFKDLVPDFDNMPMNDCVTIEENARSYIFYLAKKNGRVISVLATMTTHPGYGGPITELVSLSPSGTINGVIVNKHNETPGLGASLCDRTEKKTIRTIFRGAEKSSGMPGNWFLDQFKGKDVNAWKWFVKKDGGDVAYHTGATVTSRAVTDALHEMLVVFNKHRTTILRGGK